MAVDIRRLRKTGPQGQNILITCDGRVKILDFGLAKIVTAANTDADATRAMTRTQAGATLGTIAYMSPEQARGSLDLTAQSDQFSFGLVLDELAAGRRAFPRGSRAETMTAIIRDEADPLPPTVPAPLRWIVERLLAKDHSRFISRTAPDPRPALGGHGEWRSSGQRRCATAPTALLAEGVGQ